MPPQKLKCAIFLPLLVMMASGRQPFVADNVPDLETSRWFADVFGRPSTTTEQPTLAAPPLCSPRGGGIGVCVMNYLCQKGQHIITDGGDIIAPRDSDGCPLPQVCCPYYILYQVPTVPPTTPCPRPTISMHVPATSAEVPERKSTPPSLCRLQNDAIGVCVAYYLCKNGKLDTQGGDLLEERFSTVDGCSGSHVCCPFNTQGVTDPPPVATTRPPTPPPKPTTITGPAQADVCLKDGEIGLCVTLDRCDTSKLFGGNHIATSLRGVDTHCPAPQLCCPSDLLQPDSIEESREVTTTPVTQSGEEIDPTSTCGTRDNGETPWLVIVKDLSNVSESGNTYAGSVGGGTLIHPSVVLTTAHTVRGKRDLQVIARGDETQTRDVDSVVMHEDFNKANLRNDIALLFLFEPMRLSRRVRVACLPVAAATAPARCEAIEWAHSSPEQKAIATIDVPVLSHQDCQSKFRRTRLGWFFELNESFMCAGGERATIRCKGDGGFPLICPDENGSRFVQFGVTAWDIDCGRHGNPIAYVRVAHFRGWIDRNMLLKGLSTNTYDYNNQEPYYN